MSEEKKVTVEVTIDADADAVWRAVSEGEELKRWFPADARVTPGAGGSVWMSFGEGMAWETPIEIWEPGRRMRTANPPPMTTAVDYIIEAKGGETTLRIVHSGFAADTWDDELDQYKAGWKSFAQTLKLYLERHRGEPRTYATYRHEPVALPREEVFSRMLGALGVTLVEEGARFEGPLFTGVAEVVMPPINFSGPLENHGGGFLMIEIEPGRERYRPAVWVSLYGDAAGEASDLAARLQDVVVRAFS